AIDAGLDRLTGLRMAPEFARQGEELQRGLEVELLGRDVRRQGRALGVVALAALHLRAVGPALEADLFVGLRIDPEHALLGLGGLLRLGDRHAEPPGEAAFGIIGAADERAEASELEAKPAAAAQGADARIGAVLAR